MKKRRPLRGLLVGFLLALLVPSIREGMHTLVQPVLTPIQYVIGGVLGIALAAVVFGFPGVKRR